jgi:hypothetical protein
VESLSFCIYYIFKPSVLEKFLLIIYTYDLRFFTWRLHLRTYSLKLLFTPNLNNSLLIPTGLYFKYWYTLNQIIKCLNHIISENKSYNLRLCTFILHKFQEKNMNLNRDSNSDLQISSLEIWRSEFESQFRFKFFSWNLCNDIRFRLCRSQHSHMYVGSKHYNKLLQRVKIIKS